MERTIRTFYVLQYENAVTRRWVRYDDAEHETGAEAEASLRKERRYRNAPPLRIAMVTMSTVAWDEERP